MTQFKFYIGVLVLITLCQAVSAQTKMNPVAISDAATKIEQKVIAGVTIFMNILNWAIVNFAQLKS